MKLSPDLTGFDEICELVHNYFAPTKIEGDSKQSDGINALNWGKLAKVMNYQLPEADFHNHFTAWLTLIAEYEEESGKELDEDIKTAHITNQVIGPLASHLKLTPDLTDFDEI